ncbi:MAG: OmpA family protein [Acidobacteriota bacterium]
MATSFAALAFPTSPESQQSIIRIPSAGTNCFTLLADRVPEGPRITSGLQVLKMSFGALDVAYVEGPGTNQLEPGETMQVVRSSGKAHHPSRRATLGTVLEVMGTVEVVDVQGERGLVRITGACREIEVGDTLRPIPSETLPEVKTLPPFDSAQLVEPRDSDATLVMGAIESLAANPAGTKRMGMTAHQSYSEGDLVTIDQGGTSGWSPGDLALLIRPKGEEIYRTSGFAQPPLVVGRGLALRVEQNSAILEIVNSDFPIELGNLARRIGSALEEATAAQPSESAPGNRPPTISCDAERSTVRQGESVRLFATVDDPDGDPITVTWGVSAGTLIPEEGEEVTWSSVGVEPGEGSVTAVAADAYGGTATCGLIVTVGPAPLSGPAILSFTCPQFGSGSSRIDNRCKAVLDDVALQLRQNPEATATITGHSDSTGANDINRRVSLERADNAKGYLVETHGLDASRIITSGAGPASRSATTTPPPGAPRTGASRSSSTYAQSNWPEG